MCYISVYTRFGATVDRQLLCGIRFLHRAKVSHRDLSLENLMLRYVVATTFLLPPISIYDAHFIILLLEFKNLCWSFERISLNLLWISKRERIHYFLNAAYLNRMVAFHFRKNSVGEHCTVVIDFGQVTTIHLTMRNELYLPIQCLKLLESSTTMYRW